MSSGEGRTRGVVVLAGAKLQGRQVVMSAKRDNYLLSPRPSPGQPQHTPTIENNIIRFRSQNKK